MVMCKLKCNDDVIMLSGKDKGKRGKIKLIFPKKNKAIVSGVNFINKHKKPFPDKNRPGGIFRQEAPVDLSNIAIFNSILNKADRIKFITKNGKKVRIFKSNGNIVK